MRHSHTRMKLDHYLTSLMKSNLKWINDLNVRPETIKLLEENIGRKLLDTGHVNDNLDLTLREHSTKAKTNRWDSPK